MQLTCLASGFLIAYMWFTLAKSETVLTASMTSFLITMLAVCAWLINMVMTRGRAFYSLNLVGIVLALIGVAVMLGFNNIVQGNKNIWFALLYVSGLLTFAISAAINKVYCSGVDPFISTLYNLFYTMIILTLLALSTGHTFAHYTWPPILAILALGVLSTGVGYLIFFWLVNSAGPVFACMNGYLVPMFGFLMGGLFLSESLVWYQIMGVLIVLIGVFLTSRKKAE